MILNLIPLLVVAVAAYFIYTKFIAGKIDCPANNPNIQGLEKEEIKVAIKEGETKQKEIKDEVKQLEKERKEILASSDSDKNEKAKEKLEQKEEKMKELQEIETNLADLKTVDKGALLAKPAIAGLLKFVIGAGLAYFTAKPVIERWGSTPANRAE
ncbi:20406_t:CDS:2, partial [Racocetra persica]